MIAAIILAAIAMAVFAFALRLRRYRRWFRLPVRRNDLLSCRGSCRAIDLIVESDGLAIPDGVELRGRTVFLRVAVRVPLLLRLLDPYIEMKVGLRSCRQYFERGAIGFRYVNLSPLFSNIDGDPLPRISLRGSSLRWASEASVLVFDPPLIEGADVLVLAPHPDDAEIAAFGIYASCRSWVVTVTAGEKSTANLPSQVPAHSRPRWAAILRVLDSLYVPQLGQVPPDRTVSLVCPDGALEAMFREPDRTFRLPCEELVPRSRLRAENSLPEFQHGNPDCTWNGLVAELRQLLELSRPTVVVCPHPLVDTHSDHVFTAVALEQAIRDLGKPPLLLLYAVHSRSAPTYPFGPREALVGLPPGQSVGWIAESIYSHPLEPSTQQGKYFAVEAMHAVRDCVGRKSSGSSAALKSISREISAYLCGMSPAPASWLRRAPRPNEIYYVMRGELLTELLAQPGAPLSVAAA